MNSKIRVALADDHMMFRLGLKSALSQVEDIEIVAEAANHEEAIAMLSSAAPDIAIIDLRMPGKGGLAILIDSRRLKFTTRFIVLSSYASEEEIYQALNAGAAGYILKDVDRNELLLAVREVHRGGRYVPPAIESLVAARAVTSDLTPREFEVLGLIVKGLTNREISGVLGTSQNTVRNQTIHIFAKLEVTDRAEAVSVALQRGIVIPLE